MSCKVEKPDGAYVVVQCRDCPAQVQVRAKGSQRKRCRECHRTVCK